MRLIRGLNYRKHDIKFELDYSFFHSFIKFFFLQPGLLIVLNTFIQYLSVCESEQKVWNLKHRNL